MDSLTIANKKSRKGKKVVNSSLTPASGALVLQKPKRNRLPKVNLSRLPKLTECCARYFHALSNPWGAEAEGACIPVGNNRESHKVKVYARFTATIGSSGFGFVAIIPSLANDAPCCVYSTSGFGATAINAFVNTSGVITFASGVAYATHNGPYTVSQLVPSEPALGVGQTSSVQGRIVSAGASGQYTGTVNNMGGLFYCLTEPNHSNMFGFGTSNMGAYAESDILRVDAEKCWVVDCSHTEPEMQFTNLAAYGAADSAGTTNNYTGLIWPYSNNTPGIIGNSGPIAYTSVVSAIGAGLGAATSLIVLTGLAGNTFEVEYVSHVEYIGVSTQASVTPSHRDVVGANMVQEAVLRAPVVKQSKGVDWTTACVDALIGVAQEYGPTALRMGAKLLGSLL